MCNFLIFIIFIVISLTNNRNVSNKKFSLIRQNGKLCYIYLLFLYNNFVSYFGNIYENNKILNFK